MVVSSNIILRLIYYILILDYKAKSTENEMALNGHHKNGCGRKYDTKHQKHRTNNLKAYENQQNKISKAPALIAH